MNQPFAPDPRSARPLGSLDRLDPAALAIRVAAVRGLSLALAEPLSDADATVQAMADASPAKWHLAHTSWFFETFVLRDHVPGHRLHDDRYPFLFNSYYEAEGPRHARPQRGLITRPTLDEIRAWRRAVDAALLAALPGLPPEALALVELGLHHEQQHQELLLTDILYLFAQNPLGPAVWAEAVPTPPVVTSAPLGWHEGARGIVAIGHDGPGFAFDAEGPRHEQLLHPHALASRPVTNAEWCAFMADGGYRTPRFWLADGWDWVRSNAIAAPLHWRARTPGEPILECAGAEGFTLSGWRPLDPAAPVAHISFWEADAFAAWAAAQWPGARLPTEGEWEAAAATADADAGNQLDGAGPVRPRPTPAGRAGRPAGLFGDVWEWTGSSFRPYPGFVAAPGAVGEYNGKFMAGQFVLKGASCATPRGHSRASYRNFFHPHQRWQFTGLRLARDL